MLPERVADARLAAAIEDNLFELFRANSTLPGAEIVESEAISYHRSFPAAALFNGAWRANFSAAEIDGRIDEVLRWFEERDSPLVSWWFGVKREAAGLFERLVERGFELDYSAPGMVIENDTITDPLPMPPGLTIVQATDARALADFSTALLDAYAEYDMSPESARTWEQATLALGAANAPWKLYVGYLHGKPVATNMLFNGGGVAGLFCVGTIPEVRGKGVARPIILQPLLDARAEGYRYGVLFAAEMGIPIYEHLGFRQVGIDIGRYILYRD